LFTKRVYDTLYLHLFSHIAHYNAGGFYAEWFEGPRERSNWIHYVRQHASRGFFGSPQSCWSDVETAFYAWLEGSGIPQRFIAAAAADLESAERAELARLTEKYG
jgi:hypothetical protein